MPFSQEQSHELDAVILLPQSRIRLNQHTTIVSTIELSINNNKSFELFAAIILDGRFKSRIVELLQFAQRMYQQEVNLLQRGATFSSLLSHQLPP